MLISVRRVHLDHRNLFLRDDARSEKHPRSSLSLREHRKLEGVTAVARIPCRKAGVAGDRLGPAAAGDGLD
ncbi:putative alpha/beta hydrolase [Bradyrhizobium sp. USDA 4486]